MSLHNPLTHRALAPDDEPLYVAFLVLVVYDRDSTTDQEPAITVSLTTPELGDFATAMRPSFHSFCAAIMTMPACPARECEAMKSAIGHIFGADKVTTDLRHWHAPLQGCTGAYRINIRLPDGTMALNNSARKVRDLNSYRDDDAAFANLFSKLTAQSHLHNIVGKLSGMVHTLEFSDRAAVLCIQTVLSNEPFATARFDHRPSQSDASPSSLTQSSYAYGSKYSTYRNKWKDIAHHEIATRLPSWEPLAEENYSIQDHMHTIVKFLGQPGSDYIHTLCKEEKPFLTLMRAVLTKIHDHVQFYEDPALHNRITVALENYALETASLFNKARDLNTLTDGTGRALMRQIFSAIGEGLAIIRGILYRHNVEGMVAQEASWCLNVCRRGSHESSEDFLARMNITFNRGSTLWGNKLLLTICQSGALNHFLPNIIRQLAATKQSQALAFWDRAVSKLASSDGLEAMPREYYSMIVPHLERIKSRQPVQMDMSPLGEAMAGDSALFSKLTEVVNVDASPVTFTSAEDLDWVAKAGLLITHWNEFMSEMYARTTAVFARTVVTFTHMQSSLIPTHAHGTRIAAVMQDDGAKANEQASDDDNSDYSEDEWGIAGMGASTRPQQSNGRGGPPSRRGREERAKGGNMRPRNSPTAPAPAESTIMAELTKLSKQVEQTQQQIKQIREEGVKAHESYAKQLHGIATHATDLRHAEAVRDVAAKHDAAARKVQFSGVAAAAERNLRAAVATSGSSAKWKLEDRFPVLQYVKLSPAARTALSTALNIKDQHDLERANGPCAICDNNPDVPQNPNTWPHRIGWCPKLYGGSPEAQGKLSAATIERSKMLVAKALSSRAGIQQVLECFDCDEHREHHDTLELCMLCVGDEVAAMGAEIDDAETWLGAAAMAMSAYNLNGPFYK